MKSNVISIIIPSLNAQKDLKECLDSIFHLSYSKKKLEVLLVDNGLPTKTVQHVRKKYPDTTIIKNAKNESFARSINQGIAKSSGEYIFVANDDITFGKKSISILVDYLKHHPEVGIVGGTVYAKKNPQMITSAGYSMNPWTGAIYMQQKTHMIQQVDWIQGCALLVRSSLFSKIGTFDEGFPFFFEDFDYCERTKKSGWKIVFVPEAHFWHTGATTTNRDVQKKYTYWYQSKYRFLMKHFSLVQLLSVLCIQTFFVIPYRALRLSDTRMKPFMKGLLWNIQKLPQTLASRYQMKRHSK